MRECFEEDVLSFSGLLYFYVIAGLDPAIHKETGNVPVVRWIPGSSPGMTKNKNSPMVTKNKKPCHSECNEESSGLIKMICLTGSFDALRLTIKKGLRMTIKERDRG